MHKSNETQIMEISAMEIFQFYYTPVLVYMGIFGNMLSVYVFATTKLKKLSSTYYLAALAVSDSGFLVSLFVVWLKMINVDYFNQPVVCQLIIYLTSVCSFLSVWLVVSFTVERFIAVKYPLLRQSVCTVARARSVVATLTVVAAVMFAPQIVFATPVYDAERETMLCKVNQRWQDLAGGFNALDTVITFIIPVVMIAVLNGCISRTVWKLARVRRRLTGHGVEGRALRRHPPTGAPPPTSTSNHAAAGDASSGDEPPYGDLDKIDNFAASIEVSSTNESTAVDDDDQDAAGFTLRTAHFDRVKNMGIALKGINKTADTGVANRLQTRPRPFPRLQQVQHIRTSSSQNKVTKMLLLVSSVFLLLNMPSYVMRILAYLIEFGMIQKVDLPLFVTVQHCCLQFFYTSFGINFVLYCVSGQNFRKALRSALCNVSHCRHRGAAPANTGTTNRCFASNMFFGSAVSESRTQSFGSSIVSRKKPKTPDIIRHASTGHKCNPSTMPVRSTNVTEESTRQHRLVATV